MTLFSFSKRHGQLFQAFCEPGRSSGRDDQLDSKNKAYHFRRVATDGGFSPGQVRDERYQTLALRCASPRTPQSTDDRCAMEQELLLSRLLPPSLDTFHRKDALSIS